MVLHLGVAQIQYELIAVIVCVAVRLFDHPVGMLFIKLAPGVHHFRFDPYPEFNARIVGRLYERRDTPGEFVAGFFPVSESGMIVFPGIFVAEPSVIKQKHIYAQVFSLFHQFGQNILIEVASGVLPVVQKSHPFPLPVLKAVSARPVVKVAAALSCAVVAEREDELRSCEYVPGFKLINGGIGVYTGYHAQIADIVDLKSETEIAGPSKSAHEHFPIILLYGAVESDLKKWMCVHGGTSSQFCVDHFFAEL